MRILPSFALRMQIIVNINSLSAAVSIVSATYNCIIVLMVLRYRLNNNKENELQLNRTSYRQLIKYHNISNAIYPRTNCTSVQSYVGCTHNRLYFVQGTSIHGQEYTERGLYHS